VPLKVMVVVPLALVKATTLVPLTLNTPVVLEGHRVGFGRHRY
jgi:hypothetical protein